MVYSVTDTPYLSALFFICKNSACMRFPSSIKAGFSVGDINPSSAHLLSRSFASCAVCCALSASVAALAASCFAWFTSSSTDLPFLSKNIPRRKALSQYKPLPDGCCPFGNAESCMLLKSPRRVLFVPDNDFVLTPFNISMYGCPLSCAVI